MRAHLAGNGGFLPILHVRNLYLDSTKDGTVAALVRSDEEAYKVASTLSGRYVSVWTTEEVAKIVSHHPEIIQVKQAFPGAKVIRIRSRNARDEAGLNDPIPF